MCGGGKNKGNTVGPGGDDGPKEIKVTSVDSKTEPEDILNMFPAALKANIDDEQAQAIVEFDTSAEATKAFEESPLPKLGPMHVQWMKGGASGMGGAGAGPSHGKTNGPDSGPDAGPADDDDNPETGSIKSKPKSTGKPPVKHAHKGHMKKRQSKTGSKAGLSHSSKGSGSKHKVGKK